MLKPLRGVTLIVEFTGLRPGPQGEPFLLGPGRVSYYLMDTRIKSLWIILQYY